RRRGGWVNRRWPVQGTVFPNPATRDKAGRRRSRKWRAWPRRNKRDRVGGFPRPARRGGLWLERVSSAANYTNFHAGKQAWFGGSKSAAQRAAGVSPAEHSALPQLIHSAGKMSAAHLLVPDKLLVKLRVEASAIEQFVMRPALD